MKIYNIYFSGVQTKDAFYEAIIRAMNFPDWCGKNADAIWDMMYMDVEYPAHIFLYDTETLPGYLEHDFSLLLETFEDAREKYKVDIK